MRTLLLFLFLPVFLNAQLDKMHPGKTLEEMRKSFPAMKPDLVSMTSWVYGNDTLIGEAGKGTWMITRDTLRSYQFDSKDELGPCRPDLHKDSLDENVLMKKAITLSLTYIKQYGQPNQDGKEENKQYLFYRRWQSRGDQLTLSVERPALRDFLPNINGPGKATSSECSNCCYYKLVLRAEGNGIILKDQFRIGETKYEFRMENKRLAPQVKDFTDNWILKDSLRTDYGSWKFSFTDGKLSAFSLDVYDGEIYRHKTGDAYSLLVKRAKTLTKEAKHAYGKPDQLINAPDKYKEHSLQTYYSVVDYQASWLLSDTSVVVKVTETGGGQSGPPVFHLEVSYPVK